QRCEDFFEGRTADPPFAGRRQLQRPSAFLDHLVLLELLAELGQVDRGIDHAAILEVLHPAQRLFDIAPGLEHELKEELDELLVGQKLAQQVDREFLVAVAHGQSRATAARQARADSARSIRSLIVKTLYPSFAKPAISSRARSMMPAALPASLATVPTRSTAAR